MLRTSTSPAASANRRDRERRHYPIGRVREEGVDHDARPAIQSEKSHTAHRHEYEIQRRDRREKVKEAYGLVMVFQPPQDKAEWDAPDPAPDKRPVHVRRRERQRRRDPERGAYPGVEQKPRGEQHGRGPDEPCGEP